MCDNRLFFKKDFYSSLKNTNISDEECEDVKKLFNLLKMEALSDLKALYNFQDTIILCEIFKRRAENMQNKFKFNFRKCSSASTLSGAIHRDMLKVTISFPTKVEIVELMKKTSIGGMSIGFDSNLFIKNKNQNLVYKIKNKNKRIKNKGIVAKIIKMGKNNQYGNAMTKPLPTGCIKKKRATPQTIENYKF